MRIAVLQPPYPGEGTEDAAVRCLEWMASRLEAMRPGEQDLVLLPEFAATPGLEEPARVVAFEAAHGAGFARRLAERARELGCLIAAGLVCRRGNDWANRTLLFGPEGECVAGYDKTHLTAVERRVMGLAAGSTVVVAEHGGVRFGFATCMDIYFPEFLEAIAARGADVVLHPSYQRSETPERIRLLCRSRALDAGAYVVRSSYATGSPERGGTSLVAAPDGSIVADAGSEPGVLVCEIDPAAKFVKPASHGRPRIEHRALVGPLRRPGLYRPAGDRATRLLETPFPWICAHRGLSAACPENTLPALGAALAFAPQELEIDLWMTRDGVPVVCHDPRLDRTTDGQGVIQKMDWEEIRRLDAGARFGEAWRGVPMPRFEEVLDLVDGRAGLNLHLKDPGPDGALVRLVADLLRERALTGTCYLAGDEDVLLAAREIAPDIARACLARQDDPDTQVPLAAQLGCRRIQFGRHAAAEHYRRAHDLGLICNLFWSDEPEDARAYVARGVDVLLTNAAHRVTRAALGERE